jgi:photosystem II stability/assembly factor-like uncharacterized protein
MLKQVIAIFLFYFSFQILAQSDFDIYKYRSLGPNRGGRVTAVAGTVAQDGLFFLGSTGGGVWKSADYGTTWQNVSDGYFETPSIGAIAIDQRDPNIIYVGTGSDGIRSNVIIGKGMYKSLDGGKSWSQIGLKKAGQIGEVVIHPNNPNIVYVAAIGNPFRSNSERGIYKTVNGGESWEKVLFISDKVGFYDVEVVPGNPDILFASAWKVERKPWTIISGGTNEEGGIYKSKNGGKTWEKATKGLPQGLIGKIDIDVSVANPKTIYALVEAPNEEGGLYRSNNQGKSFELVSNDSKIRTRPFYYTNVKVDPKDPDKVYVLATGFYRSDDGGKKWNRMKSPHGDNHDMWIHPEHPDIIIQSNDGGANVTFNGGLTWSTQFNQPTAELYQVEVDDQYPYWLYAGQQDNYTTIAVPSLPPDARQGNRNAYIINTGGCETGPAVPLPGNPDIVFSNCKGRFSVFDKRTGIESRYDVGAYYMYGHSPNELPYRFQRVSPIHVSPHDPNVIYHTSQYVHKTTDQGLTWETISPDLTAFESDKQVVSGSPITRDITGEEFYSTIYSIRESPIQKGVIWVGANDGPVHVTQSGGESWTNVTPPDLPEGGRVDAVEPSPHDSAKAYISVLRYQLGDFKPYVYRTTNYGASWELLTSGQNGIPNDYPVRVIREDLVSEGLLYAGTEYGMFISRDDGNSWESFQQNLPITPVTDIKLINEDLVLSTMGRGFYCIDDLSSLRQSLDTSFSSHTLFNPRTNIRYRYPSTGARSYPRSVTYFDYYLASDIESLVIEISDHLGNKVNSFANGANGKEIRIEDMSLNLDDYSVQKSLGIKKGLHRFTWDMRFRGPWYPESIKEHANGPMVAPGKFEVKLIVENDTLIQEIELQTDPRVVQLGISDEEIVETVTFNLKVRDMISRANKLVDKLDKALETIESEKEQLEEIKKKLITAEGTYQKPMLVDQIGYLYYLSIGSDMAIGNETRKRYYQLEQQLAELEEHIKTLL